MKTTLSEREGNTVKLEVEVSSDELQEAFDTRLRQLTREVRIPGFRTGKVPASMVRQRLGEEAIITDAIEHGMERWFVSAVEEVGVNPVDKPQIDAGDDVPELGKPFSFTATVTVMPEVELGQYQGLEVAEQDDAVTDEEVDAQFERLRSEFAELRPVEGRTVNRRDFLTVDFSGMFEGEPVPGLEALDFVFEVGMGRLFPEIEVNAIGMKAGEEKTFKLALPQEFGETQAAGQQVDFTMKVKEIKEKILPPLTDKWASEISEFETLLELKQEIRKQIQGAKTFSAKQRFRSLAVQQAVDNATLDLPDVIVTEQAQQMLIELTKSMAVQGGNIRDYFQSMGMTADQAIEQMKPEAANNVKTGLVLDAIAEAEGLEASDEDIKRAVQDMATAARTDADELEESLRKRNRLDPIKWQVLREKAAELIAANAVGVTPPPEEESPAATETTPQTGSEAAAETTDEPSSEAVDTPETADVPEATDESGAADEGQSTGTPA